MTKHSPFPILLLLAGLPGSAVAQAPAPPVSLSQPNERSFPPADGLPVADSAIGGDPTACWNPVPQRGLFESDRAFPGFIGPISNPILSKDPRSLTEGRFLFIHDVLPPEHALGGGNFQVYGLQLRAAVTDRLTLIADKDGIANIQAHGIDHRTGLLNMNFGLKYLLVRDVEDQFLWSVGLSYEPPMGERNVLENHGDGVMSVFTTAGKEVACRWHVLDTFGYQFGLDSAQNSSFFYNSLHLDRQTFGWLYPLIELNWFHYTQGGNRGLPPALGEGDGLLNLGTSGVAGNDLLTLAVGLKAKLGDHADTGLAWEVPLSNRKDLIDNRLLFEFILRY
jgi:hypothetical protein